MSGPVGDDNTPEAIECEAHGRGHLAAERDAPDFLDSPLDRDYDGEVSELVAAWDALGLPDGVAILRDAYEYGYALEQAHYERHHGEEA